MSSAEQSTRQFYEQLGVGRQPAQKLADKFHTVDHLVDFLVHGGDLTDFDGVGEQTASAVWRWFKDEYPDKLREHKQRDEAYCTEFTADHGLSPDDLAGADGPVWGWVCPRCDHTNPMDGDPDGFRERPYACVNCRWVPLLDGKALDAFAEELGGGDE